MGFKGLTWKDYSDCYMCMDVVVNPSSGSVPALYADPWTPSMDPSLLCMTDPFYGSIPSPYAYLPEQMDLSPGSIAACMTDPWTPPQEPSLLVC